MASAIALFSGCARSTGVEIAASGTRAALESAGYEVTHCDLANAGSWTQAARAELNIIHANPDELRRALGGPSVLAAALGGRPSIGYWVWEAPGMPRSWSPWLPLMDELWVPSSFVKQAVASQVERPVAVVPHPLLPTRPTHTREELGLPPARFLFLFVFNARSNIGRKNPAGLIRAYRSAFPAATGEALLVVKSINMRTEDAEALSRLADGRRDIRFIDQEFDSGRLASLVAACDCYVSLHRAEGFGLTVAEAMFHARPVICTGYSGVTDFAGPDTAYLVDYKLKRLEKQHGVFPGGAIFAEPDLAHAAALMRRAFENRAEAQAVGLRAAVVIAQLLAPETVGTRMRTLIEGKLQEHWEDD